MDVHNEATGPRINATELLARSIADLDLESLPERLDDQQLAMVRRNAETPLPSLPPCSERDFAKCLRIMLAVLPRQGSDDLSGELFVEAYYRQLGQMPVAAMGYLVDQSTRECRWFPTIVECLEILSGWRRCDADTLRQSKASALASAEERARYNETRPPVEAQEPWQPTREELDALKRAASNSLRADR